MATLSRYEMETVVNYNAGEDIATIYTAGKSVIRRLDILVEEFPEQYRLEKETELARWYSMPKLFVTYRKPRKLTDEQREQKRVLIEQINKNDS